jgi:hypothetical protein
MALNFLTLLATALFGTADAEIRKSDRRRWKCQRTNETLNTSNSSQLGEGAGFRGALSKVGRG